ncbi:MAG: alanine--tRNA ligase-related protein, partial [Clostridia bacterium]
MNIKSAGELRSLYLKFFEGKGHAVIPSASVIPENDPTVLFTTA